MCLVVFSVNNHPIYKFVAIANRDEFYERPTQKAHWWNNAKILAGRDLKANGTWMGVTKNEKFAALTNFRSPSEIDVNKKTRGEIVSDYLTSDLTIETFLTKLKQKNDYNGYNLILFDSERAAYFSNKQNSIHFLEKGTYAVSNALLDTPWQKLAIAKKKINDIIENATVFDTEKAFEIMKNKDITVDTELPETGVGLEIERMLSPIFVQSKQYGTRSTTLFLLTHDGHASYEERTYYPTQEIIKMKFITP